MAAYPVGKSIDGLYAFRPESRLDGKDNDMAIVKALNFTYAGYRVDKVSLRTSSIPVWGSTSKDPYTRLGSVRAVAIKSRSFSSEYIGQNAFSAKITVNKLEIEEFNIVVDRIPRPMTVNLEVNRARAVLFICKLRPPLFHDGYSKKEATFTDPWDVSTKHKVLYVDLKAIWFCDAASGEILRKYSLD